MVVKSKAPQEDPETKARRLQAEKQAEDRNIRETTKDVSRETMALLRRFGIRAAFAGSPGGGGGGGGGGRSSGPGGTPGTGGTGSAGGIGGNGGLSGNGGFFQQVV